MEAQRIIDTLRRLHERLTATVGALSLEAYSSPSYDTEWTIAQVLSHLGAQYDILPLILDAGLAGTDAPGLPQFQPIWDVWNAKDPERQVADYATTTSAALDRVDGLSAGDRADFSIAMFGMTLDLRTLLQMRLNEHSLHTWDVEVALDPTALVDSDADALVIDLALKLAERVGRPQTDMLPASFHVEDLDRSFLVEFDPVVRFVPDGTALPSRSAHMQVESLLRLIAGRLDATHQPSNAALHGLTLEEMRRVFPGY